MAIEKTFLMIKPDGVKRQVIGDIVNRFERRGFELKGAKLMVASRENRRSSLCRTCGQTFLR